MKHLLLLFFCATLFACGGESTTTENNENKENTEASTDETFTEASDAPAIEIKDQVVEASCGQCNFGLKGGGCDLAIRVDGKAYFVDGSSINDHGDAHAEHGFCSAVRKAKVAGKVENNRFLASSFELIPVEEGTTEETPEEHDHDHDGHDHDH